MSTQEFARQAARKYLQSIVFVDDEIYQQVPSKIFEVEVSTPSTMQIFAKPMEPAAKGMVDAHAGGADDVVEADQVNGGHFHPKQLVESFARERMVCALYEPQQDFPTDSSSDVFKLCERADVVILDWEFHKEPGKKVKELVQRLVSMAQTTVPHHVRLCAIYTSTPNLKHVARELFEHLEKSNLVVNVDGEYKLNAGSSRIIVLGKPSSGGLDEQIRDAEVKEENLAERIIDEFASMHEGILPSLALHGLASIRTNTKKILDKFQKGMDGAFLVQRGLILPGDDAFEQIPELLAEEALAVMVDGWIDRDQAKALAEDKIKQMDIKTVWTLKSGEADAPPGTLPTKLLECGASAVKNEVKLTPKALKTLHDELDTEEISSQFRLAVLYTSRTQYGEKRTLEFGTIIRYLNANEDNTALYAICLMPQCDCVHLKRDKSYSFPFWKLRTDNMGASSKGIVVELPEGEDFVELFSMGKPRDQLWLADFIAGEEEMVVAEKDNNHAKFLFIDKSTTTFEWIAQLKPSHAQRIAHDIGSSFSRVGVIEAEWLRLKADRQ